MDEGVINTINNLDLQGLMPVFVIDDVALKANNQLLDHIDFYNDAIKIILSMESPKTLPPEHQLQFDGYLQKPASLSQLIAEVNHLYELKIRKEKINTHLPVQLAFKQFLQQHPNLSHSSVSVASATSPVNNYNVLLDTPIQLVDAGQTSVDSATDAHHSSQKLILIAEDNPVNQKIAKKHLETLGYRYLVADDGEQAVKLLSENRQRIGLVLMDCRMPILDGIEATRIIRLNKDSVPIVALTANDSDDDRNICLEAGMDSFLTKPINKQKLIEAINHYMV